MTDLPCTPEAVLLALGCPAAAQTDALRAKAAAAIDRARALSEPRSVGRCFALDRIGGRPCLPIDLPLPGEDIARHLDGCDRVYLSATTLGHATERELLRLAHDPEAALYFDAACSVLVEVAADAHDEAALAGLRHRRATFRYAPGYGDLPLSIQPRLLAVLDAPRVIGLSLTASGLMLPRKSITGLVGLA